MKLFGNSDVDEPKPAARGNWSHALQETQHDLHKLKEKLMATITDLDAAIATLATAATAITGTVQDLETKLVAAQAAGTPPDLSAEVAKLNSLAAALNTAIATDPAPTPAPVVPAPVAPTPATPPTA